MNVFHSHERRWPTRSEMAKLQNVKLIVFDDTKRLAQHGMLHNVDLLNGNFLEKGLSSVYLGELAVEGGPALTICASLLADPG
jgi:hypothetical protein